MARPLLSSLTRTSTLTTASSVSSRTGGGIATAPRSAAYLAALRRLDSRTALAQIDVQQISDAVHREFADTWCSQPVGFVACCHLGPPYEVHTLAADVSGSCIVEHFELGRPMSHGLEHARALAASDRYALIEVYSDRLVCVAHNGNATVLEKEAER